MDLMEIFGGGVGVAALILTLVQIAPIKINPWSAIARAIGKAINAELEKELREIKQDLKEHVEESARIAANDHRARILHFNNELLRGIEHTKEEYIETLAEIDAYEEYCRENPDYTNNRAVLDVKNIQSSYMDRLKKHDFL